MSDLCINLSAGWFGAMFIVPTLSEKPLQTNIPLLIFDLVLGIVFLVISYKLRRLARKDYGHR